MKKTLAILLALMLVLVNVAALATELEPAEGEETAATDYTKGETYALAASEPQTLKITKEYEVTATDNWSLPTDKLTFTQKSAVVEDGGVEAEAGTVAITAEAITGGEKVSYDVTIALPSYASVGVYYYTFTETDNKVAGVTYIKNDITLRVTVIQNQKENKLEVAGIAIRLGGEDGKADEGYDASTKVDQLDNKYEAGSLIIDKTVTGNMGDYEAEWNFTVKFTAEDGKKVYGPITYGEGEDAKTIEGNGWTEKEVQIVLKHGESIQFDNIPANTKYEVVEEEAASTDGKTKNEDGYTTVATDDAGTIESKATANAKFVNDKSVEIDTGVTVETLPYVMILAIAMIGAVVMLRKREEY